VATALMTDYTGKEIDGELNAAGNQAAR